MTFTLILGIVGMLLILVAFFLDEFVKKWSQHSVRYNVVNLIGSGLLVYYSFMINSVPFLVLNIVWFATAGYKLLLIKKII